MAGGMSTIAREELIRTIRSRYRESTKMEKTRILDELAAVVGCHRKHAIRLLGLSAEGGAEPTVARGRRIYDEAVREALIVVWETSDRICGKRLKAVLPSLIEAMERHGHLDLGSPRPPASRFGQPGDHRPAFQAHQGDGRWPSQAADQEEEGEPASSGADVC